MSIDLTMAAGVEGADVVHSHTWYANLAGHLGTLVHDIPHVATVHSLEPLRPWKAEQLGGGYALSSVVRADRAGGRRRGDRGLGGDARRHPRRVPGDRPVARAGDLQRDRRGRVRARPGHRRARAPRRRPGRGRRSSSSAGSRGRRACRTWSTRRWSSTRPRSSCSARGRRTRRRSAPTSRARGAAAGGARQRDLDRRDAAEAGRHPAPLATRPSSPARRSTSRWGSSTSRRWPARRRSSRRRRAGSSRSSSTARRACSSRSSRSPAGSSRPTRTAFVAAIAERVNALMRGSGAGGGDGARGPRAGGRGVRLARDRRRDGRRVYRSVVRWRHQLRIERVTNVRALPGSRAGACHRRRMGGKRRNPGPVPVPLDVLHRIGGERRAGRRGRAGYRRSPRAARDPAGRCRRAAAARGARRHARGSTVTSRGGG